MKKIAFLLIIVFLSNSAAIISAQNPQQFDKIELLVPSGDKPDEKSVVVSFDENSMTIKAKNSALEKTFTYTEIKSAEYSYSKNPRWKTGLGLGATAILFPPILLVAIPLGFTKHRRHWLTIRTENDFAVLKLSKSNRKIFIPAFETKSGVTVQAVGEDK
ncbi:hypothetical protein BH20ACI4_BH20ACI4_32660 [soil metagenome]